ncbi:serine hydrolase [Sphingorhabdus sp. M41]|uniref:serine hydrolase n=1 Tax=Sphingorhabdus sp. M41 TaxID=1806885 RepID=UPI00078E9996|nr:serine hydrolase [Sphingorhabdus sp. M41]AMO72396.1 serine hydrolase [Sphingorhabdus sp. M41]
MNIQTAEKRERLRYFRHISILVLTVTLSACVSAPNRPVARPDNAPPPVYQNRAPSAPPRVDNARELPNPALVREIDQLWRTFPGKTGIAVKRIDGGWEFGHRSDEYFPQQSVSKLWVAMAMLDKIDQGRASLSDPIRIGKEDLTVFHQPMAVEVEREGSVVKSVYTLLEKALASSDNTANDALLRHAGGPDAVRRFIAKNSLGKIRFGPGERLLQSGIAGMEWKQDLSYRRTFYAARAKIPVEQRRQSLNAYLADPVDGASPIAIVRALDKLARGELLSDNSTKLLQSILKRTRSGPNRLKAGVPAGWEFLHKTGTGQVLGSMATGYNDIGIMTAPDGTRYAVVVMMGDTTASIPERMRMMQAVTRAVARYHPG